MDHIDRQFGKWGYLEALEASARRNKAKKREPTFTECLFPARGHLVSVLHITEGQHSDTGPPECNNDAIEHQKGR